MLEFYLKRRNTFYILTGALSTIALLDLLYLLVISPFRIYSLTYQETTIDYTGVHLICTMVFIVATCLASSCYLRYSAYANEYKKELRYEHLRNNLPDDWVEVKFCINNTVYQIFSTKIRGAYVRKAAGNTLDLKIAYKNKEKVFTISFKEALKFINLKTFLD